MEYNNRKEIVCINCNKIGHTFKQCHQPISSYGIIAFKIDNNTKDIYFLMICRKDTFHYVEFMRGRYDLDNSDYLESLLDGLTGFERDQILNNNFDYLWINLWMTKNNESKNQERYNREYYDSKNKFSKLKENNYFKKYFEKSEIKWSEPEWGFPKGRRNLGEQDLDCAIREFEEESGLSSDQYNIVDIRLVSNSFDINEDSLCDPTYKVKEVFTGTNNLKYKHVYYLAICNNNIQVKLDENNFDQSSEISNIKWFQYSDCLKKIRPYNKEKIKVLDEVHNYVYRNWIQE